MGNATQETLVEVLEAVGGALPSSSIFVNFGADATKNVKASPGSVRAFSCRNTNAGGGMRFLQLHNTATFPAADAVPRVEFPVAAGTAVVIGTDFFSAKGIAFATGIAFAFSTTSGTYTAGSAGDQTTQVVYT